RTDWGLYPCNATATGTSSAVVVNDSTSFLYQELSGTATSGTNISTNTNIAGEHGPIEYIKATTLSSIVDPFRQAGGAAPGDGKVYYFATATGKHWCLFAYTGIGNTIYMYRTDGSSTTADVATLADIDTAFGSLP
ncbi:MAG: hypothetical protein ACP5SB_06525, partial [Caldisericaceae bacterium]